ncbi:MAG: hypothetical protein U0V75_01230 [Ferruginibacter sp.]
MITQNKIQRKFVYNGLRRNKELAVDMGYALTKSELRSFNLFCFGLMTYTVGYAPTMCTVKAISGSALQGIQIAGLVILFSGFFGLVKFQLEDKYIENVLKALLVYGLVVVARGIKFDVDSLKTVVFDPDYTIFVYLVPMVLLFPRKLELYKRLFYFLNLYGVLFLVFCAIFWDILLMPDWRNWEAQYDMDCFFLYFAFPAIFNLFFYVFQKKQRNIFLFIVTLLSVYLTIYRARRGAILMNVTALLGILMVYLIYTKRTFWIIFLSVFFTLFMSVFMSNVKLPSMFDNLQQRGDDDTRTGVELAMKADMNPVQWVFGKGLGGTYYCPLIVDDPNNITFQRRVIETGYLQIILNGGILYLALLGMILFPAVYKGLLKSHNAFTKGAAIFILLWIFYQYPRIVTGFNMYYIEIWIAAGICLSEKIRNMSDDTIKAYLNRSVNR